MTAYIVLVLDGSQEIFYPPPIDAAWLLARHPLGSIVNTRTHLAITPAVGQLTPDRYQLINESARAGAHVGGEFLLCRSASVMCDLPPELHASSSLHCNIMSFQKLLLSSPLNE